MNWFKRLQKSLAYIEEHIQEELDSKTISGIAHASEFHFQRMFYAITDMSLWEYIRKRRLSLATSDLVQSNRKIIDVALDYGYESPESFSRAFKAFHGVTPSQAKTEGVQLVAFPPLSIQIIVQGDKQMEYRIENKKSFIIKGTSKQVSTKNDENFKVIPQFWNEVVEDGSFAKMLDTVDNKVSYGVCTDYDENTKSFVYVIGVNDSGQDDYEAFQIPKSDWAIFTSVGKLPDAIQSVIKRIFKEWLPATDFERADGPELEVYLPGDPSKDDYKCEVWIPVKKKSQV